MSEQHVRIVVADFGPVDRWTWEERVASLVESVPGGEFDGTGTDLGTGEFEVFIYGPDANALVAALTPFLRESNAAGMRLKVLKRAGDVELDLEPVDIG